MEVKKQNNEKNENRKRSVEEKKTDSGKNKNRKRSVEEKKPENQTQTRGGQDSNSDLSDEDDDFSEEDDEFNPREGEQDDDDDDLNLLDDEFDFNPREGEEEGLFFFGTVFFFLHFPKYQKKKRKKKKAFPEDPPEFMASIDDLLTSNGQSEDTDDFWNDSYVIDPTQSYSDPVEIKQAPTGEIPTGGELSAASNPFDVDVKTKYEKKAGYSDRDKLHLIINTKWRCLMEKQTNGLFRPGHASPPPNIYKNHITKKGCVVQLKTHGPAPSKQLRAFFLLKKFEYFFYIFLAK